MLAKKPGHRYQTPAAVAEALRPFETAHKPVPPERGEDSRPPQPSWIGEAALPPLPGTRPVKAVPPQAPTRVQEESPFAALDPAGGSQASSRAQEKSRRKGTSRGAGAEQKKWPAWVMAVPLALAFVLVATLLVEVLSPPKVKVVAGPDQGDAYVPGEGQQIGNRPHAKDASGPVVPKPAGKLLAYQHGDGRWRIEGDELVQDDSSALTFILFGDPSWADYDVTVEARRMAGSMLCYVPFRCESLLSFWAVGLGQGSTIALRADGTHKAISSRGGWQVDDDWHKIGLRLRGSSIECFLDGQALYSFEDDRHPRGYMGLTTPKTATRFRNLKVTDPRGGVLVDGIRSLTIVADQGTAPDNDKVRKGSTWKGKVRVNANGKDQPPYDLMLRVYKRVGTMFEGEMLVWVGSDPWRMAIKGNVDPKGNITWTGTEFLVQGGLANENIGTVVMGVARGKQIRGHAYYGRPDGLNAELSVTLVD
jgi:hypothetical protein